MRRESSKYEHRYKDTLYVRTLRLDAGLMLAGCAASWRRSPRVATLLGSLAVMKFCASRVEEAPARVQATTASLLSWLLMLSQGLGERRDGYTPTAVSLLFLWLYGKRAIGLAAPLGTGN